MTPHPKTARLGSDADETAFKAEQKRRRKAIRQNLTGKSPEQLEDLLVQAIEQRQELLYLLETVHQMVHLMGSKAACSAMCATSSYVQDHVCSPGEAEVVTNLVKQDMQHIDSVARELVDAVLEAAGSKTDPSEVH